MQGNVYQIAAPRHGNQPHLHVVVLEFSGNKDCIVVPAFSAEGHKVNEVIQAWLDQGYRIDQVAVTLDNTGHIQFTSQHTGKVPLARIGRRSPADHRVAEPSASWGDGS